jgi:hypothetical protein
MHFGAIKHTPRGIAWRGVTEIPPLCLLPMSHRVASSLSLRAWMPCLEPTDRDVGICDRNRPTASNHLICAHALNAKRSDSYISSFAYQIKSRRMRWARHAQKRWGMHTKIWSENLKRRDHLENFGTDGRIILNWILYIIDHARSSWSRVTLAYH